MVNDDRFWEKNIMGENISVTKIKHLEKFMQNIPLNIFFKDTECKYISAFVEKIVRCYTCSRPLYILI